MTAPALTAAQRLAQAWKKVELAFFNLEMANQRHIAPAVLDRLIAKHAEAVAAYRSVLQEGGADVGHA